MDMNARPWPRKIVNVLVEDGLQEFPRRGQSLGRILYRGSQITGLRNIHSSGETHKSEIGAREESQEGGGSVNGFLSRHSQLSVVRIDQILFRAQCVSSAGRNRDLRYGNSPSIYG